MLLFSLHVYFDTNKFAELYVRCEARVASKGLAFPRSTPGGGQPETDKQFIFWVNMLVVTAFSFRLPSAAGEEEKNRSATRHMQKAEWIVCFTSLHDTINVRLTSELRALKSMLELLVAPDFFSFCVFRAQRNRERGEKNPVECTTNSDTRSRSFFRALQLVSLPI